MCSWPRPASARRPCAALGVLRAADSSVRAWSTSLRRSASASRASASRSAASRSGSAAAAAADLRLAEPARQAPRTAIPHPGRRGCESAGRRRGSARSAVRRLGSPKRSRRRQQRRGRRFRRRGDRARRHPSPSAPATTAGVGLKGDAGSGETAGGGELRGLPGPRRQASPPRMTGRDRERRPRSRLSPPALRPPRGGGARRSLGRARPWPLPSWPPLPGAEQHARAGAAPTWIPCRRPCRRITRAGWDRCRGTGLPALPSRLLFGLELLLSGLSLSKLLRLRLLLRLLLGGAIPLCLLALGDLLGRRRGGGGRRRRGRRLRFGLRLQARLISGVGVAGRLRL